MACTHFQQGHAGNIRSLEGAFTDKLPGALQDMPRVDMAFIDGHHVGTATIGYAQAILTHLHTNSVMVLDDIHWSPDMEQAWHTLRQLLTVSISIDLFDIGLLFFHPGQAKEHFRLHY